MAGGGHEPDLVVALGLFVRGPTGVGVLEAGIVLAVRRAAALRAKYAKTG
jgi:hypothetical protein